MRLQSKTRSSFRVFKNRDTNNELRTMAAALQGSIRFATCALLLLAGAIHAFEFPWGRDTVYSIGNSAYHNQDIYGYTVGDFIGNPNVNLAFINASAAHPALYTLAILINADPGDAAENPSWKTSRVIWEANRDDPVKFNATVTVTSNGDLVLSDVDGRRVWSTDTANKGATNISLQENGNLMVYNSTTVLWQSFDHPTDTLVLGQTLKPGMRLQSRSSHSNGASGVYSLVMEPGGLVLYSNASGSPQPYWIRGYYEGRNDLAAAQHTCKSLSQATLTDSSGLQLEMRSADITATTGMQLQALCSLNTSEAYKLLSYTIEASNGSFIRLEWDGNVRAYALGGGFLWNTFEMLEICQLPEGCKSFGKCANKQCQCVKSSDGQRSDCSLPRVESCASDTSSLEFIQLERGLEYFSSKYINSTQRPVSLEECKNQCLKNCSCAAFFYWNESSSCFTASNVTTLQEVENPMHIAYLKSTKARAPGPSSGTLMAAIGGGVSGGVFLLAAVLGCVFWHSKRRKQLQAVNYDSDTFLESLENIRPMRFSFADLEKLTGNFSNILGTGGFGGVYEGALPDGRKVAVKKLESTGQGKEFYAEVAILGTLHHGNLVKLLGFCSEGSNRLLVYEYVVNGSLDKWIFHEKFMGWRTRMDVLLGTARGLAYLHEECTEKIIHLDIKPQNILLDDVFVAKVADFGLSRLISRDQSTAVTTMRGTPGYLAPEWLLDAAITEKGDVYSFGVVMLEVLSGKKNFTRETDVYLPTFALELMEQGRQMELLDPRVDGVDKKEANRIIRIAFQCMQLNASSRPSMGKVVQMFEGLCEVPDAIPSKMFSNLSGNNSSIASSNSACNSSTSTTSSLLKSIG